MVDPTGVPPQLPTPEDAASDKVQEDILMSVTSLLIGFMSLFFLNRMYVKLWLVRKVTWDDGRYCSGNCHRE
jgi:hypothetical protein